jgi:hypothetical protein
LQMGSQPTLLPVGYLFSPGQRDKFLCPFMYAPQQPPSSSVPLLTPDALGSPLPGRSAWPIVPFVRG